MSLHIPYFQRIQNIGVGHRVAESEPVTALYDRCLPVIRAGGGVIEVVVTSQKTN
jgi:hypothetical protein